MSITLDAVFATFQQSFVTLFQAPAGSPVLFRFDAFGSVITDSDFRDPNQPGYSQPRAMEKFSDLVNHIPMESDDDLRLVFSLSSIDDTYFFRMLSPSLPYTTDDSPASQEIVSAFGAIKANASHLWNDLKAESTSGLMLQYRPSVASPSNWYDTGADIWTQQSFAISTPAAQASTGPARALLWKMKVEDVALANIIQTRQIQLSNPAIRAAMARPLPTLATVAAAPAAASLAGASSRSFMAARTQVAFAPVSMLPAAVAAAPSTAADVAPTPPAYHIQDAIRANVADIAISDRLQLAQAIDTAAPSAPATTDSVSISFDYCLVNIRRPWYLDVFVTDGTWYVPGAVKGSLTTTGSFHLLPVAFVVIKNLSIEASWTQDDLNAAANATHLGPFKVTSGIAQGKLTHEGIQVVGWLVQPMPDLPPQDPPAPASGASGTA
jgi:hypothetical protein